MALQVSLPLPWTQNLQTHSNTLASPNSLVATPSRAASVISVPEQPTFSAFQVVTKLSSATLYAINFAIPAQGKDAFMLNPELHARSLRSVQCGLFLQIFARILMAFCSQLRLPIPQQDFRPWGCCHIVPSSCGFMCSTCDFLFERSGLNFCGQGPQVTDC